MTIPFVKDSDPAAKDAWELGKLVIVATFSVGPDAGQRAMCFMTRREFRRLLADAKEMELDGTSLSQSIRDTVMKGIATARRQKFVDDLVILMAERFLGRADEEYLAECGIFSIALSINPDETKPWNKRGFLNPRDQNDPLPVIR